ncbi:unnamed protein product [Mytilus edulis]|uniref:RanBP2-type domain-containing protein n=1 Tax=Mytilus edulis TaxID=6550 RepID=A0A8S3VPB0_MYTED|nr:unnamed protein product [Mytilus edulis]
MSSDESDGDFEGFSETNIINAEQEVLVAEERLRIILNEQGIGDDSDGNLIESVTGQLKKKWLFVVDNGPSEAPASSVVRMHLVRLVNFLAYDSVTQISFEKLNSKDNPAGRPYASENLVLNVYTKTSSRVAIDALGKSSPGGSYKTLKHWLSTYAETVPKCPDGTLITGFDNEQVVGYKRGLGEGSKSLTSVITTIVNTTMHDKENSTVQLNENFKPKNWFSVNHFDEKLKNANSDETNAERVKRIKTEKEYFVKEVSQIRDSSLPLFTTLEKIHYDQMYFFLSKAIKDVLNEQENANDEIIDYVDKQAHQESRQKNIIVCTRCGTENPKRKQICENCQEREGIKEAKQAQQRTRKCDDVSKSVGSFLQLPVLVNFRKSVFGKFRSLP